MGRVITYLTLPISQLTSLWLSVKSLLVEYLITTAELRWRDNLQRLKSHLQKYNGSSSHLRHRCLWHGLV